MGGGYYTYFRCVDVPSGIDRFHNFGIRNSTDFYDFGISNGIHAFSDNWYKVGYIFSGDWL